ncbi:MAG TPA: RNA methyltransferase [Acidimicrobiales bacterium]|nr:RNA methyltransferase [Acidimicrobiales bacterium]
MTRLIPSADAEFQVLRALRTNREKRNRENAFLVEGVRNIDAALSHGWTARSVLSTRGSRRSQWATSVIERVSEHVELGGELFDQLTDREERPELLLVVEKRSTSLAEITVTEEFVATVVDRPSSPGNIGTMIRTSDAFGGAVVVVTGHGADPYDPRAVRASTGSFFAVPVVDVANAGALANWAAQHNVALVATDEQGGTSLQDLPAGPAAYLFGNETTGLSRSLRDAAAVTVSIPMGGTASSLNVAAAHAIVLFSVTSMRRE